MFPMIFPCKQKRKPHWLKHVLLGPRTGSHSDFVCALLQPWFLSVIMVGFGWHAFHVSKEKTILSGACLLTDQTPSVPYQCSRLEFKGSCQVDCSSPLFLWFFCCKSRYSPSTHRHSLLTIINQLPRHLVFRSPRLGTGLLRPCSRPTSIASWWNSSHERSPLPSWHP